MAGRWRRRWGGLQSGRVARQPAIGGKRVGKEKAEAWRDKFGTDGETQIDFALPRPSRESVRIGVLVDGGGALKRRGDVEAGAAARCRQHHRQPVGSGSKKCVASPTASPCSVTAGCRRPWSGSSWLVGALIRMIVGRAVHEVKSTVQWDARCSVIEDDLSIQETGDGGRG